MNPNDLFSFPPNPHRCTSLGAIKLMEWLKEKDTPLAKFERLMQRSAGSISRRVNYPRNGAPLNKAIREEIEEVSGIPADDWLVFTEFMPKPKPRKLKPVKSPPFIPWKLEVIERLARIESALVTLATLKEST